MRQKYIWHLLVLNILGEMCVVDPHFDMYMHMGLQGFLLSCIFICFVVFIMDLISNHVQIYDIQVLLFLYLGGQLLLGGMYFHEVKGVFEELQ